ncbi:immunoglobulin kappa light chain-like [Phyllobates terribilis]|uniref:immunoglobulin kappa light chain-like n=1 Tax=Phyllobates terribilis TaxID=111132 RepID=UPI003CCA71BA
MTMGLQGVVLGAILLLLHESCAQIALTQSPNLITVFPGETVTISCYAVSNVGNGYLHWYQQKPGQRPTLLIHGTSNRQTGVPDRFYGSGSGPSYGTAFSLTISGATEDDAADYYCQQSASWYTFGQKTTVEIKRREDAAPSVSIFRASEEELNIGKATSVCLIEKFYPRDVKVVWKADKKVVTSDVKDSDYIKDEDNTYRMNSMLTLSSEEYRKYTEIACEVTHKTLSSAVAKSFKTAEC